MSKESMGERALAVLDAIAWPESGPLAMSRGGLTLIFDAPPELVLDREGNVVGVDAMVRAFRAGREVRIDPHRRFINPPTWHNGEYDPQGAYEEILFQSIERAPAPQGWRTRGTVDTFYAGTEDGRVVGESGTYSTARSTATNAASSVSVNTVGQYNTASVYNCVEAFIQFDTSTISDSSVVSAVVLSLFGDNINADNAFTIQVRLHDWGDSLTTADWVAGASLSSKTLMASYPTSSYVDNAYNDFTSEAAFASNVSLTGSTRLLLNSSRHLAGNAPGADVFEYVSWSSADVSGTTQDPKLTVTHQADPVNVSVAGATAAMDLAGNAATVAAQLTESIVGEPAQMSLDANPAAIQTAPFASIQGESATMTLVASAGVVATVRNALVIGERALLSLAALAGAIPRAPGGTATVAIQAASRVAARVRATASAIVSLREP